jgi:alpha-galactosidase
VPQAMPQAAAHPQEAQPVPLVWEAGGGLALHIGTGADGVPRLTALVPAGASPSADADAGVSRALPLVEVQLVGSGRDWSGERGVDTAAGARLRYQGHETGRDGAWRTLRVDLADPETGLAVQAHYRSPDGIAVVQSRVHLRNDGERPVVVETVASFAISPLPTAAATGADGVGGLDTLDVHWADNEWLAEHRWHRQALRASLIDLNRAAHEHDPRGSFHRSSQGSWSAGRTLPLGALTDRASGTALLWQIESSGGWRWELGERTGGAYLGLFGPTDRDHHWRQLLHPGDEFTSVPAAVAAVSAHDDTGAVDATDGFTRAVAEMTRYRRALRRPHPDHERLPVIFNDYMNTLMGDPTTEKLLPLIDAAADAGAEVFMIDAGWYDDDAGGWWDSVGAWEESRSRFPGGLAKVTERIRERGLVPGLWLEPEVVGVRSPLADALPEDAFFQRDGVRVVEHGRYHLDLRHPAARAHLDGVVDRLVADYGAGYFKLDYNVNPGPGTDLGGSPGAGLLGHQRAYAAWLAGLVERHPGLTLENCASGGLRPDYALLARAQIQSTSDQQDPLRYPPIAAAAQAAIAPEQAAVWAYPQPGFTDDRIAFTLCTALLGRVHLSGYLNRMTDAQRALVAEAVDVYKALRADLPAATPFWPLGLPGWTDPWIAQGLRADASTYVTVWRRAAQDDGTSDDGPDRALAVPHLRGRAATARVLYPSAAGAEAAWHAESGTVIVHLPRTDTACLMALVPA